MDAPNQSGITDAGLESAVQSNGGGSRTFGNTTISWTPSTERPAVTVVVTIDGVQIDSRVLTPFDPQMRYSAAIKKDAAEGTVTGVWRASGRDGTLQGDLSWTEGEGNGSYRGVVGIWNT